MERHGHLFKSDRHTAVMDSIVAAIDNPEPAQTVKNAHRKWADLVP